MKRHVDILLCLALLLLTLWAVWPNATLAGNQFGDQRDYTYPAIHLLQGRGLVDIFNGVKYPPSHSFGAMLLFVPGYLIFGTGNPGNAIYMVTLAALVCVCLLYIVAMELFNDRKVAVLASLLLIACEMFRWLGVCILADLFSLAIWLGAFALVLCEKRNWLVIGLLAGFGVCVHPTNIFLLVPLAWFAAQEVNRARIWHRLAVGLAIWAVAWLGVNYAYTGNCLRTEREVRLAFNTQMFSPNNALKPFGYQSDEMAFAGQGGALDKIVEQAAFQWSLMDTGNPVRRGIYYGLDIFALIGLLALAKHRNFMALFALSILPLVAFHSCNGEVGTRFFLRAVPLICTATAYGIMSLPWKLLKIPALIGTIVASAYLVCHPYDAIDRYYPTVAIARETASLVKEDNAIVIGNVPASPIEEYVIKGSHRRYVPLDYSAISGQCLVQWHRPPHSEWITNREPYDRAKMGQNGTQLIYPHSAADNFPQIGDWFWQGRPLYLAVFGPGSSEDFTVKMGLEKWYHLRILARDAIPLSAKPPSSLTNRAALFHFEIAKLEAK